jgi:hypothetical protein
LLQEKSMIRLLSYPLFCVFCLFVCFFVSHTFILVNLLGCPHWPRKARLQ